MTYYLLQTVVRDNEQSNEIHDSGYVREMYRFKKLPFVFRKIGQVIKSIRFVDKWLSRTIEIAQTTKAFRITDS